MDKTTRTRMLHDGEVVTLIGKPRKMTPASNVQVRDRYGNVYDVRWRDLEEMDAEDARASFTFGDPE